MPTIDASRLREFTAVLQKYKSGKAALERRVVAAENWWKLRNRFEESRGGVHSETGFQSESGWLHNVIVSKHADAMDAFPEPVILPREPGDREQAKLLAAVLPCILEQNRFEQTYDHAMWQKLKTGTACYRVVWDPEKYGGLGDIAIERVDLLNLFWEPGVNDIQKSKYFFCTHLEDEDALQTRYPQLKGRLRSNPFLATRFVYDDAVSLEGKATVIEVYYKKPQPDGSTVLHYCKYVGDTVLYATENEALALPAASSDLSFRTSDRVTGVGIRTPGGQADDTDREERIVPRRADPTAVCALPRNDRDGAERVSPASPVLAAETGGAGLPRQRKKEGADTQLSAQAGSGAERVSPASPVLAAEPSGAGLPRQRKKEGADTDFSPEGGKEVERVSSDAAGLYAHGKYPFVFDPLFPVEGSPCGYGFVDLCANNQTAIDLMRTAFVKNALVGATPRYFERVDGSVNEEEFLDLGRPLVHVSGNLGEDSLRQIGFAGLPGAYLAVLESTIRELRETSGNTETSTGTVHAGVTAASAIAALQEASSKGSRDSARASYRAFAEIVELCIELIREFYTLPRQFRITGSFGEDYVSFSNIALQPRPLPAVGGLELGLSAPVFDVKVAAQRRSAYSRLSQNELAMELYRLGLFEQGRETQALQCLELMDFDGKDALIGRLGAALGLREKLQELERYRSLALALAKRYRPDLALGLLGEEPAPPPADFAPDAGGEVDLGGEDPEVEAARVQTAEAVQP